MPEDEVTGLHRINGNSHGKGFSSTNQPSNPGRKKTSEIMKLMREMGKKLAPKDIREHPAVVEFLTENNLEGTVNEVLLARLYSLALYGGDLKAIKLILDTLNGKYGGRKSGGVVINFISPPQQEQEKPIDLENDSWTISQPPGESASD